MAKEHKVAYHKWYIVSGPVGGKVTNADGTVTYCTIPEGGEGCFYAVSTNVYTDNAAVQVDEIVNFNGALVASAGSGSGGACLVTKDANCNYLLGEDATASRVVYFGTGLGQSSEVRGNEAVAVGYRALAAKNGVSVGARANSTYTGSVTIGYNSRTTGKFGVSVGNYSESFLNSIAVGYNASSSSTESIVVGNFARNFDSTYSIAVGSGAICSNGGQIALGYKAAALEGHASAVGLEAKAGYGYSTAIGEKTSTYEISSLILAARSPDPGCVLTLELLAKDIRATGEDGAIGDANAFITGGALRFGVRDLVSGERETMTISVESLWAMLRAAGGVSEKTVVNEYYY